jgi:hypothetical protein
MIQIVDIAEQVKDPSKTLEEVKKILRCCGLGLVSLVSLYNNVKEESRRKLIKKHTVRYIKYYKRNNMPVYKDVLYYKTGRAGATTVYMINGKEYNFGTASRPNMQVITLAINAARDVIPPALYREAFYMSGLTVDLTLRLVKAWGPRIQKYLWELIDPRVVTAYDLERIPEEYILSIEYKKSCAVIVNSGLTGKNNNI